jgi:toxin ParE1/3/4
MSKIHKWSSARVDLAELAEYLRQDSPRVALRFLRAAERTFALLASQPGMGIRYRAEAPGPVELRRFPVSGFERYLIFYRATGAGIEIVRVIHSARDIATLLEEFE